jgi:hypothetical protein
VPDDFLLFTGSATRQLGGAVADYFMELLFWIDALSRASAASDAIEAIGHRRHPLLQLRQERQEGRAAVSIRARVCADDWRAFLANPASGSTTTRSDSALAAMASHGTGMALQIVQGDVEEALDLEPPGFSTGRAKGPSGPIAPRTFPFNFFAAPGGVTTSMQSR